MSITNYSDYSVVSGTSDADDIYNYGSNVTVQANSGNDKIVSFSKSIVGDSYEGNIKIYGGAGNDSISAFGDSVISYGDSGADSIYVGGNDSTIIGGTGNDTIYIGVVTERLSIQYELGDGVDFVQFFDNAKNSTVNIGGTSNYGRYDSGNDAVITVGSSGSITFQNMAGKTININTVSSSSGDYTSKYISDSSNNVLIEGSAADDTIETFGDTVTIDGGYGADEITFYSSNSSVYGGYGIYDDTINATSFADYSTIKGGWGNDYISISSYAEGVLIQHSYLDNYDTITGFDGNDSIEVTGGTYSTVNSGNDLLVKIESSSGSSYDGSILLLGMAGQSVNIIGTETGSGTTSAQQTDADSVVAQTAEYTDIVLNGGRNVRVYPNGKMLDLGTGEVMYDPDAAASVTSHGGDIYINYITNNYITNVNNTYTYRGGDQIINNYVSNEIVDITNINYTGIGIEDNTFYINSFDGGRLGIENVRDKVVTYDRKGNQFARYSYIASGGGFIDGTWMTERSMLIGADYADNQIAAGSGGSSMWGGLGGNDILRGGDGYDEFFYSPGDGNDIIQNASDGDLVNLIGVSLSQITYAEVYQSEINIAFNDGCNLKMQGQAATGFCLEGVIYVADRNTGGWYAR